MTHIPLCQTKGCPFPSSEEWHRCFVCGKAEGDHHHFPPKGMGGHNPESEIVAFLCPFHHKKISLHQWRDGVYPHPDGSRRYYVQNAKGEEMMKERIIEEAPASVDKGWTDIPAVPPLDEPREAQTVVNAEAELAAYFQAHKDDPDEWEDEPTPAIVGPVESLSDDDLARLYIHADHLQADGFLLKCKVVQAYRERHVQAWGESWVENAYELFHVSRRTLQAYANIAVLTDNSDTYLLENIGPLTSSKSLMTHIGRKSLEDGKVALEAAVTHLAEFGEPPSVGQLAHRLGEEAKLSGDCDESVDGKHLWHCHCMLCGKER